MPRNLLVVDDSPTIWEAVRCALTGEDWVVTAVASGAEALEAIRRSVPDVVLCDVALGEEDGYQVCRALRAQAAGSSLPVILMGGTVSETLASAAGAVGVLAKPFQSDELLDVLQTALEMVPMAPDEGGDAEHLAFEPTAHPGPRVEAATATAAAADEVEIIDLSEGEDLPDVEFLEDLEPLEPLSAPVRAGEPGRREPLPFSDDGLDLGVPGAEAVPEGPSARGLGGSAFEGAGLVELDLSDFETQPAPDRAPAGRPPAGEGSLPPELDPLRLEEPEAPGAQPLKSETADLLEDIDLEGWAEEDLPAAPQPEDLRGAAAPHDSFDLGLEDLEPLPAEGTAAPTQDLAPAAEGFAPVEQTRESWEDAPAGGRREESEQPLPAFDLAVERSAAPGEGPEPSDAASRAALGDDRPQEPDEAWAEPQPASPAAPAWDRVALEPQDAAAHVAAGAADAVRRALLESLSPDKLTPLVAATVERVVWEVVPQLAERLIREAIAKLQSEPPDEA